MTGLRRRVPALPNTELRKRSWELGAAWLWDVRKPVCMTAKNALSWAEEGEVHKRNQ